MMCDTYYTACACGGYIGSHISHTRITTTTTTRRRPPTPATAAASESSSNSGGRRGRGWSCMMWCSWRCAAAWWPGWTGGTRSGAFIPTIVLTSYVYICICIYMYISSHPPPPHPKKTNKQNTHIIPVHLQHPPHSTPKHTHAHTHTPRLLTSAYLSAPRLPSRSLDLLSDCLKEDNKGGGASGGRVMQGLMTLVELALYRPTVQVGGWGGEGFVVCVV